MKSRVLSLVLFPILLVGALLIVSRIACPLASMHSKMESDERLRIHTHKRLDYLLELRKGERYDQWDDADKMHYQNIRETLAELGEDIPEEPANP